MLEHGAVASLSSVFSESDDEDSGRGWRSNTVIERKSARLLGASDGKVAGPVKLLGKLDIDSMLKEGFSETVVESFNGGFPENWYELLEGEFSRIQTEKTKDKAGRGKREKKPSKKKTEAVAAAEVASKAKERPTRKKSAAEEAKERKRKATEKMDQAAAAALLALDADDCDSEQDD